jgi:hypothetical protein
VISDSFRSLKDVALAASKSEGKAALRDLLLPEGQAEDLIEFWRSETLAD